MDVPNPQKTSTVRRVGLLVNVRCSAECQVIVGAFRSGALQGHGRRALRRRGTVRVRLNRRGRRALRRNSVNFDVLGQASNRAGRRSPVVEDTATVRRKG
jgi:hypothetical protein